MLFKNRQQAGQLLGEKLSSYQGSGGIVVGLARGGVVVANIVARALSFPVDVVVIKKVSGPSDPELALGAVAPDDVSFIDDQFFRQLGVDEQYLWETVKKQSGIVRQKMQLYRKDRSPLAVQGKTVIIVDDGAATGATMMAAVRWVKKKRAGKIIIALPVAPPDVVKKLQPEVDDMVVLATPDDFGSVGQWYEHFDQVEDEEVVRLLKSDQSDQ